jgi:acetylornithine deacetylase
MEQEQNWLAHNTQETIERLQQLIGTTSFSREEELAAMLFEQWMQHDGIAYQREGNNIWARNKHFNPGRPVLLLNSHIDTVKPNSGYTRNPFGAAIENNRLYGLGSTDAGGALLCLYAVFKWFYHQPDLRYNLVFAATAEEEVSGTGGIARILGKIGNIDLAIVGEPTQMHLAVAEKGLLVIDCVAHGKAGHAAREEGENALYKAMQDIGWFQSFRFPRISSSLGEVKMNVTIIESGTQHNVVPATCRFTVDVRSTDAYTHEEILEVIRQNVGSDITPRSLRLNPSSVDASHPVVEAAVALGRQTFGSPTLSDQALMPFPSVKIGPGDSARSHQADEFIYLHELEEGIKIYFQLLNELLH